MSKCACGWDVLDCDRQARSDDGDGHAHRVEELERPIEPSELVHYVAILSCLTDEEQRIARLLADDCGPLEIRQWIAVFENLSIPDGIKRIRQSIYAGGGQ